MSKVVVIWSSPNTDGLTASAKECFDLILAVTVKVRFFERIKRKCIYPIH